MTIPSHPWILMLRIYRDVIPTVNGHLSKWKERAKQIPDPELRKQALTSLETKAFHCEGGAIYGLLARDYREEAIDFIVTYQTISDYLDNLCDRSTSLNPDDFRALHESIFHALTPGAKCTNYYRYRQEQEDGGYLRKLVKTCQTVLQKMPAYEKTSVTLHELATYYCDLQVHKHVQIEERIPRLKAWYALYQHKLPQMSWYEFSAATGSTLGIFCLISYGFDKNFSEDMSQLVKNSYFPWLQGLHILLDYLIDQDEDHINGDLNFCDFYKNHYQMSQRFLTFFQNANKSAAKLPDTNFHRIINQALLGIYLADNKVQQQKEVHQMAKYLLNKGGATAYFFYLNGRIMAYLRSWSK
ncbi:MULTISPECIES: tetraprenyl-beta-curcumene synthase family protein [Calothrix]|uniref:tetraprenyl-beta-curcumene synthase family protein n=1 Tax=Calothrix TaxID=1186 RepID=UPI003BB698CD